MNISNQNNSPQIEVDQAGNRLKINIDGTMEVGLRLFGELFTTEHEITVELVYNLTTGELVPQYSLWFYN